MSAASNTTPRKRIVFVVDDNAALLRTCELVLAHAGYHVVTAPNGAFALRVLEQTSSIDLVLCDVFMPEADGLDVIETVREKLPGVPVIAMSGGFAGVSASEALSRCAELGARKVLSKPFSEQDLVRAVAAILGPSENFLRSQRP